MANIVEFKNVSMSFGNTHVLKNIDLEIEKGKFYTLLGPSGCGKSTILKLIGGFLSPTSGDVLLDDKVVNDLPANKRHVNTVFQDYALFPHMNVFENVAFALEIAGMTNREIKTTVPKVIELVGLKGKEKSFPHQLSGGERQRVAIARALVNNPALVLADEPTGNLDHKTTESIFELIQTLNAEQNIAFLLVTHDMSLAQKLSRCLTMQDGILKEGA